jgi:hypothetical protein
MVAPNLGGRDSRVKAQGQPGQKKLVRPCLKEQTGVLVHICNPNYVGSISRRMAVQSQSKQIEGDLI